MVTPQGPAPIPAPASTEGQVPAPASGTADVQPAVGVPENLQQFVAQPAAPAPAPQEGPEQGQASQTGTPDARHFQSLYNKTFAENLALQQRLQFLEQRITQQPAARPEQNPFDPQTDFAGWIDWRLTKAEQGAAQAAAEASRQSIVSLAQSAYEQQWQQSHPDIDISLVRQWGQMNGVTSLDHAYTLMTLPQRMSQVSEASQQSAINQFRQPQQSATPVRSVGGGAQVTALSYEKLAAEYQRTNGAAYDAWPPQLQQMFDRETYARSDAGRRG